MVLWLQMNMLIWAIIIVVVLRAYAKQWLYWAVAAVVVVIAPHVVEVGAQAIARAVWGKAASDIVSMINPMLIIVQLIIAFGVLYWLERREESLTDWAIGVGLLFFGLVFVAPYIATMLP